MTRSNEELMIAFCKDLDHGVFTELIRRTEEMVRRVLSKYGEQLAEDLTQETFLTVLTNRERYDSRENFNGWLVTVAMNVARDHFRKQHSRRRTPEHGSPTRFEDVRNVPAADSLSRKIDADYIKYLVSRLPPDQGAMVDGVYLNQKSWRDAAADARIPIGTAHHVLNRGLERLRERITAEMNASA
jgi:RNA polymerase sigma factor (sigma-70 family)